MITFILGMIVGYGIAMVLLICYNWLQENIVDVEDSVEPDDYDEYIIIKN